MALGICTVYQELSLLPHLSVAENVLLGRMPARGLPFVIDWREANRIAGRVLADFGFPDLDPAAPVGQPQRRAPTDRRDRQGAGHRAAHPDPRRADRGAVGLGDGAALRQGQEPRRGGWDRPLHLAPAGGDLRDRRRDRRAQGRRERAGRAGGRARPGPDHPRHGRPAAVGDLSRARRPARPGGAGGRAARPARQLRGRELRGARRRDRRHVRPRRQRPHRGGQGDLRRAARRCRVRAAGRQGRPLRHARPRRCGAASRC